MNLFSCFKATRVEEPKDLKPGETHTVTKGVAAHIIRMGLSCEVCGTVGTQTLVSCVDGVYTYGPFTKIEYGQYNKRHFWVCVDHKDHEIEAKISELA